MRLLYVATGILIPPITFKLYANHLFSVYPPDPTTGQDTISTIVPRCSLDTYVDHFYGTWMLRIEGFAAKLNGYPHTDGKDYANGLFQVVSRSTVQPHSMTVGYTMPRPALRLVSWIGQSIPPAGTQSFSVSDLGDGQSRLEYTCVETWKDQRPGKAEWWHRLYMRVLLEQTKRDIIKDAKRSRSKE